MNARPSTLAWLLFCIAVSIGPLPAQRRGGAPAAEAAPTTLTATGVPRDLKPLLAPPASEMAIVVNWYNADRSTLSGNYSGTGGGARGGRGGRAGGGTRGGEASAAVAPAPISAARLARLKRFDQNWLEALGRIDTARLSPAAREDLAALEQTIRANMGQLERDAALMEQVAPYVPFGTAIVALDEARRRMETLDAQQAAIVLDRLLPQIAEVRAKVEAGATTGTAPAGALQPDVEMARRAAATVDALRGALEAWHDFYDGYDPLFMWWMAHPYPLVQQALTDYAALLRGPAAEAASGRPRTPLPTGVVLAAAPPPPRLDVPDLAMLLSLPQDEMRNVLQAFRGAGGPRGGGRGIPAGRGGARRGGGDDGSDEPQLGDQDSSPTAEQPARGRRGGGGAAGGAGARSEQYYRDWLAALQTLDFDRLSRNAQVDYLYIRKSCETAIARLNTPPQENIPRKQDNSGIPGAARGRVGLMLDLAAEMIPYTPEQLIAIGEREFAWCIDEMKKAAREMGLGDDWRAAVERCKQMHVPPGGQPAMIRDLLFEAVDYLRANDLIDVPQVASESLRMTMMSPERQLVNPFFTGGASISVSYPHVTMNTQWKLESMRGNNIPFSHATAFHEMIPGHNYVGYMGGRFRDYRPSLGGTSFFGEGWPVYWETLMYDLGFHDTPEERIGALFWRLHRCARIVFSLKFHMGQWSPQECIDYLVNEVGHERENATAEVRRSFQGGYGPLYQAAYLLGALQLRGLKKECVDSGRMSYRQFHDAVIRLGSMPIAMIRLTLTDQPLRPDMDVDWKFYGEVDAAPAQ